MKIVRLDIDEDSILAGIDAVALVEKPAIEEDFFAFADEQFAETYSDYPEAAVEAAKQGIKRNEANGNKCATQVGKVRAQQLANREPVSLDTVRRMRSFLIRQKDNYELQRDRKAYDECGYISYLLWGGEAALPWAEKVLRQAGEEFAGDYKSNRGKEVFLLSCSATKLEKSAPARELYSSPLFQKSLDYAERHCTSEDNIAILSAKYYLVPLDTVIKPYDLTLNEMSRDQRKQWANTVFIKILEKYNMQKDKFVFLAGEAYTEFLLPKFKYKVNLLEGKKIGERMSWLDKYYICFNDDEYAGELIKEAMAKIGPRGGVVESKKAPKSDTPNPNPKGEGTAKGEAGTTRGAEVSKEVEETLKKKSDEFNERYKDKLGYGANVGALKSVYQRGLGAYNTSRSPSVAAAGGAKQWAMARVNAFLYLLKEGRPQNKKYTTDFDLLPEGHPKKEQFNQIMFAVGVPHYTKDGKLYEGPTHMGPDGRLMTGAVHTADSEFLYHYDELSLDVSALPNYVNEPTGKLIAISGSSYIDELSEEIQEAILKSLISVGKSEADVLAEGFMEVDREAFIKQAFATINSSPNKPSSEDFGNYSIRYQYVGPQDSKNRSFCSTMLSKDLLFRKEDINNLSVKGANKEFGFYDVFRYKGSYNCRHYWQEKFYLKDTKVTEAGRSIENVMRTTQAGVINPKARTKGHEQDRAGAGENRISFASIDDQQMLVGPLMTPGKLIPRKDENDDTYYVYFTEDSIRKIAYKAMQDKIIDRVNIEHQSNELVDDVYLVETWLVEDPEKDKSVNYGFKPIKGQWFGIYKVDNEDIWEGYVKPGLVKGFSVEGYFAEQVIKQ